MSDKRRADAGNMWATFRRYARAFVLALRFTLRGEKPPLTQVGDPYPDLRRWWDETIRLVEEVERNAHANGVDPAGVILHIDRRDISMATILQTVKYHAQREYPYLMAHGDPHSALTLQATNLNDRYLIQQLGERTGTLEDSVSALATHLRNMPGSSSQ